MSLGDICEFKYGKSLPAKNREPGDFPVYGSNGVVGSHLAHISNGPTIVIGRKGSFGEVHLSEGSCWPIDTTYYVDRSCTSVDLDWLAHLLPTLGLKELNRAAAIPGLNREDAYRRTLRLPPLEEQRRIAAILDQADALQAKRREALVHLSELRRSVYLDLFSSAKSSWPVVVLGDVAAVKGGKRLPKGAEYADGVTPHPYIRVVDLDAGDVATSDLRYLPSDVQQQIARYTVTERDVIISIAGSIGQVAAVPEALAGANLTENAAKIIPRDKRQYEPGWLADTLRSARLQAQIRTHVGQVTIGKLALFRIEKLAFPLPPLELQREYLARVAPVRSLLEVNRLDEAAFDILSSSLQGRAFAGRL